MTISREKLDGQLGTAGRRNGRGLKALGKGGSWKKGRNKRARRVSFRDWSSGSHSD